jgi:ribonuclease VapC
VTIVVDSSALIAILFSEPEGAAFARLLVEADDVAMSAVTLHETRLVYAKRMLAADQTKLDELLRLVRASIRPFDEEQADVAFKAFTRFGQGRYGLNLCDCASYALARSLGAPLLFKGEDFSRTDISRAADRHV